MPTNRRKNLNQRFGYIPRPVLLSEEFQALNYAHRHLLLCIAAQYNGHNNGHLTFTRQDGLRFGFRSEDTRCKALKRLQELGLIIKTHKGGIDVLGATRWELPWAPLNYRNGEKLPVTIPAKGWSAKKQNRGTAERSGKAPLNSASTPSHGTTKRRANDQATTPLNGAHIDSRAEVGGSPGRQSGPSGEPPSFRSA